MNSWLVKTEPELFSFADLLTAPEQTASWDGVRNYQARNYLMAMALGDRVLVYHSSCKVPGVAGVATVVRTHYPDPTQFDPDSRYFDPQSTVAKPRWVAVDLRAVSYLSRFVTLSELRTEPALRDLKLLQRGNRLSVMPLCEREYQAMVALADRLRSDDDA
jgi:predicted RNA-binding protein with PUA-like domain